MYGERRREVDVILECNYEELRALKQGAHAVLDTSGAEPCGQAVLAPPGHRAEVEALVPRLDGPVVVTTLAEQRAIEGAVDVIVECLRSEMEAAVGATHPAHEGAVAAYFDFAHGLSVLHRLREIGSEMEAVIEVLTGAPADDTHAATFVFPD